ncbi:adenylate/guanylate cyclase domain-containing protein [Rhodovibrionaceae bacterium A322]
MSVMMNVTEINRDLRAREAAQPVFDWLLGDGRWLLTRTTLFFAGFCNKLREVGIPVERCSLHIRQLHPQIQARSLVWNSDAGGAVQIDRHRGVDNSHAYHASPIKPIYEGSAPIRRLLESPDCPNDFPVLDDLRDQAYSDYTVRPLAYSLNKNPNAISLSTRRPGGFSDGDLAVVDLLMPAFAGALEIIETKSTARTLLDTYVGRNAGEQVLAGDITRGQGQNINAVLWMSDMRDFSDLSSELEQDEVIALLNSYFGVMGDAIESHGGEILKFIGDAVLAIFPTDGACIRCYEPAERALSAAEEALAALEEFNHLRKGDCREPKIRTGIALHIGRMTYGNVGAADRLDFTVIGSSVNLVARLEDLTKQLDPPLVFSESLAKCLRRPLKSLGHHNLKGFSEPQEAFTLAG